MKTKDPTKEDVLVLNRNYIAVGILKVPEAFNRLFAGTCTPLLWEGEGEYYPLSLDAWLELPVREGVDIAIHTSKRAIRVPTLILALRFEDVPKSKRPLDNRGIQERDGNRCQYTGQVVPPGEGNVDHYVPKRHGGQNRWTNMVWTFKWINDLKKDKMPGEVSLNGKPLKLIRTPKEPLPVPRFVKIPPREDRPEWNNFLFK